MNIDIDLKLGVTAFFTIEKFTEDDTITYRGEPFENTILNNGLDLLADSTVGSIPAFVNLGSSDAAVDVTQTGLQARLFSTNTLFNNTNYGGFSYYPHYFFQKKIFQFNIGSCSGTFREIGLSVGNNSNYFNRQLIKDSNGNPMDLVVAATEGVRISVELRVSFDTFKPYSQIYKLDIKGATSGTITFRKDATTKTITWANLVTTQTLFGGYSIPTINYVDFINALNTFAANYPVTQIIKDPADGNYLIMCNPENAADFGMTIDSHTLVGGSGPPTLSDAQPYTSQIVTGTWNHTNETTSEVIPINFSLMPVCRVSGAWQDNHGFWGTYVEWLAGLGGGFGTWSVSPSGYNGASSITTEETVYESTNLKRRKKKSYWSPGALSANTATITQFFVYGGGGGYYDSGKLFKIDITPSIVVTNADEYEITYNLYWGRVVS